MRSKNCFIFLALLLLAIVSPSNLSNANCTIDSSTLDRGEKKAFVNAGESQGLSPVCAEGLTLLQGKWPSLTLLSQTEVDRISPEVKARYNIDPPLVCKESSIRAMVKVQGHQRYPAKIIISKVRLASGEEDRMKDYL
jgi:hypothetical protein